MILEYDNLFQIAGVFFLPWIGDSYHGGFRGRRRIHAKSSVCSGF
jgi:hypothetical protein